MNRDQPVTVTIFPPFPLERVAGRGGFENIVAEMLASEQEIATKGVVPTAGPSELESDSERSKTTAAIPGSAAEEEKESSVAQQRGASLLSFSLQAEATNDKDHCCDCSAGSQCGNKCRCVRAMKVCTKCSALAKNKCENIKEWAGVGVRARSANVGANMASPGKAVGAKCNADESPKTAKTQKDQPSAVLEAARAKLAKGGVSNLTAEESQALSEAMAASEKKVSETEQKRIQEAKRMMDRVEEMKKKSEVSGKIRQQQAIMTAAVSAGGDSENPGKGKKRKFDSQDNQSASKKSKPDGERAAAEPSGKRQFVPRSLFAGFSKQHTQPVRPRAQIRATGNEETRSVSQRLSKFLVVSGLGLQVHFTSEGEAWQATVNFLYARGEGYQALIDEKDSEDLQPVWAFKMQRRAPGASSTWRKQMPVPWKVEFHSAQAAEEVLNRWRACVEAGHRHPLTIRPFDERRTYHPREDGSEGEQPNVSRNNSIGVNTRWKAQEVTEERPATRWKFTRAESASTEEQPREPATAAGVTVIPKGSHCEETKPDVAVVSPPAVKVESQPQSTSQVTDESIGVAAGQQLQLVRALEALAGPLSVFRQHAVQMNQPSVPASLMQPAVRPLNHPPMMAASAVGHQLVQWPSAAAGYTQVPYGYGGRLAHLSPQSVYQPTAAMYYNMAVAPQYPVAPPGYYATAPYTQHPYPY
jgi:hypothetical protein